MSYLLKNSILILLFIVIKTPTLQAQNTFEPGSRIEFDTYVRHSNTVTTEGEFLDGSVNYIRKGVKFIVVDTIYINNELHYRLGLSGTMQSLNEKKINNGNTCLAGYYNGQFFNVPQSEVLLKGGFTPPVEDRFSIGFLTIPFKFRLQSKKGLDFDTDFNLNTTLNIRLTKFYDINMYFQCGAGTGTTNINSSNSSNDNIEPTKVATLTWVSGLMMQYKKVQAGLYLGVDFINNNEHYQWDYNRKPWIGFGIGYQLFQIGMGDRKEERKKQ